MKKLLAMTLSLFLALGLIGNTSVMAENVSEKQLVTWVNVLFPQPEAGKTPKDVYFSAETEPKNAIKEEELKKIDISDYWNVSEDGKNYTRMKTSDAFELGKYYKLNPMDLMDVAFELMGNMNAYINKDVASGLAKDYKILINDVEIPMNGGMGELLAKVTLALDYGVCVEKVNNIEVKIANPVVGAKQITEAELVGDDKDKVELVKDENEAIVTWIDEATGKNMAKDDKYEAGKRYTACVSAKLKEYRVYADNYIATVNGTTADVSKVDDSTCKIKYTCIVESEITYAKKRSLVANKNFSDKTFKYVVTKKASKDGKKAGEVAITGLVKKNIKKANIKATVKLGSLKYKVTAINKNAFKGAKKLKAVTVGKNVKTIGAKAFYNLKNLKKITIKAKKISKIGKKAFFNKGKKLTIKVDKKAKKSIKKLLKKAKCKGFIVK